MATPKKLAENIFFHGCYVRKWGFLRTLHSGCIRSVRRILKELDPDIVHAQGTERWCAVSGLTSSKPKVLTIHGNLSIINRLVKPTPRAYWTLQTMLEKFCIPRYDGVFCNSESTLAAVKTEAQRTWRVDNPIKSMFFQESLVQRKIVSDIVFLNIGVVRELKQQLELGRFFQRLRRSGVPIKIKFLGGVGSGKYQEEFHEMLKDGEREGFAEYVGFKKGGELIIEMDRAHALIHTPLEEAFGLVIPESICRGLKVFTMAVGGIVDIVNELDGVVMVDAHDWNSMEEHIVKWVDSGANYHGGEAADKMRQRYHPSVIAAQHIEIYEELLGMPSVKCSEVSGGSINPS